jgi:PDZ domain/PQQ-like domain
VPNPRLVPFLLSLCAAQWSWSAEPIVATPFDVRHDANELFDDIYQSRSDVGIILERVQQLLVKHGDAMIVRGEVCAPIAELFPALLREKGLLDTFVRTYSGIADRRLQDAFDNGDNENSIRALALAYPGTPAAQRAWARLADRAWDSGRVGQYVHYATRAEEFAHPTLRARFAAAQALLIPTQRITLPSSLDGLEEMWRIDVNAAATNRAPSPLLDDRSARRLRRAAPATATARGYSITASDGELSAASDGQRLFLFDHLIGRLASDVHAVGGIPLSPLQSKPAALRDGFVAVGWMDERIVVVALDRLGEVAWRSHSPQQNSPPAMSAPIVMDNVVIVAAMSTNNADGAELRAMAFRSDNGKPVWNTLVTRVAIPRHMLFQSGEFGMAPPSITQHNGQVVILSNNGILARVSIDGHVNRLWTYPSVSDEFDDGLGKNKNSARLGAVLSDGTWLAASPVDSPGLIVTMGPDDVAPKHFQGDGANGEVLDIAGGQALIGSARTLALIDVSRGEAQWAVSFPGGRDGNYGRIGDQAIFMTTAEQLALLDKKTGRLLSSRGLGQGMSLALTPEFVLATTQENVIGWGRGTSFLERLTTATTQNPGDYRPWGTLASFYDSRGDSAQSVRCYFEALQRGAPVDFAESAARIIRGQLELHAGNEETFAGPLAKLQALATYQTRLANELLVWKARHAELRGNKADALALYRAADKGESYRIMMKDRIEVSIGALIHSGLERLGNAPAKTLTKKSPLTTTTSPVSLNPWRVDGQRGEKTIISGDQIIGFHDGFLRAHHVSDGRQLWSRQPNRQLLGVRSTINANMELENGIPIQEVVVGSSAAAAGMQSGDILLEFQGRKTTNFDRDLRQIVMSLPPGSAFTMKVARADKELVLNGSLGGESVEPLMANQHTALFWLTVDLTNPQARPSAEPQGMWFGAMDLATGKELFRYGLPPTTRNGPPPQPLLTDDNYVLTMEGADLICFAAQGIPAGESPRILWRLPLGENKMSQIRLLANGLLWLPEDGRNRVHIIDLASGVTRYVLPEDMASDPLIIGNTCMSLGQAGRLSCWDLGMGRLSWRSDKVYARLHALSGDAIYASDEQNQLVILDAANGQLRRRFGDWTTIENVARDGDYLCLFVRRADRSQALARIALSGGHVVWEQRLPPGIEIQKIVTAPQSFGVVMSEGPDHHTFLQLGPQGNIQTACLVGRDDGIMPVPNGALIYGPHGMQALPPVENKTSPALACVSLPEEKDLATLYRQQKNALTWQTVGSGNANANSAYAVARQKNALLLFARVGSNDTQLNIVLGDGVETIDTVGQCVVFTHNQLPQVSFGSVMKALINGANADAAGDTNGLLFAVRLLAAPERLPGSPLFLRALSSEQLTPGQSPWWLRATWRPLTGAP